MGAGLSGAQFQKLRLTFGQPDRGPHRGDRLWGTQPRPCDGQFPLHLCYHPEQLDGSRDQARIARWRDCAYRSWLLPIQIQSIQDAGMVPGATEQAPGPEKGEIA